jgi:zinc transport system ATP-binding protein
VKRPPTNPMATPTTNPENILSVRNLAISFEGRTVIHGLNFDLHAGDNLAVIGPNGAGKSVLLKALLGLVPYEGEIRWSPKARLGYVPQKVVADRRMPINIQDLLAAKARFLKLPSQAVGDVAETVGLTDLLNTSMGILSGGQFQKALIAFALLGDPNVLLFDEPTASLDELAQERIYELVAQLRQEKGMTVILVSHDLSIVFRSASLVLCMCKDRPCMGPPHEVLTPEMLERLYAAPAQYYQHQHGHRKLRRTGTGQ